MFENFKKFILRGNVVDLAVGVIIGSAFSDIVSSFSKDVITPVIAIFGGLPDFSNLSFQIGNNAIRYGSFLNSVTAFLVSAAIIYFLIVVPMNRFAPEEEEKPSTKSCPYCQKKIAKKAIKCPFCTADLKQ